MTARYTPRDPQYECTCANCRFGHVGPCAVTISVSSGPLKGERRCACRRSVCKK